MCMYIYIYIYIYGMKYYSALEKKLSFATTWMDLKNTMLSAPHPEGQILHDIHMEYNKSRTQ
jgi:hypothetical protein